MERLVFVVDQHEKHLKMEKQQNLSQIDFEQIIFLLTDNEEDDREDHDEDAGEEAVVGAGAVHRVVVGGAAHKVVLLPSHHAHRLEVEKEKKGGIS